VTPLRRIRGGRNNAPEPFRIYDFLFPLRGVLIFCDDDAGWDTSAMGKMYISGLATPIGWLLAWAGFGTACFELDAKEQGGEWERMRGLADAMEEELWLATDEALKSVAAEDGLLEGR
jgi:hypothetical protein